MKIEGLDEFIGKMKKASNGGFKKEATLWLEAAGMEFLNVIQDEIIRTKTVDTRRLLNSFSRGDSENVWSITKGGLTLEIGTDISYAQYVNDGHFTVDPNSGKDRRWVPGWKVSNRFGGESFVYDPNAKDGMLLKIKWVDGTGYWDSALAIYEKIFNKSLEKNLQAWLDTF